MSDSKIALMREKVKLSMRADVYKSRAKYYLSLINHFTRINNEDKIEGNDSISLTLNHFGDIQPSDCFFIDSDLFVDLLKIQANRYWHRHDQCMDAVLKIEKALKREN